VWFLIMKQAYIAKRFNRSSLEVIAKAEEICNDYARQGLDLTIRQLYYQFVARDLIRNNQNEYKRIVQIMNDARMAGLIDWGHIVDRTRFLRGNSHWTNPADVLKSAAYGFMRDRWANQEERVEIWIEKDALVGVIQNPCETWDVPYFACRGYSSVSELRRAGLRLARHERMGKHTTVIHLGDHDPSGIDMTRDIEDRLRIFGSSVDVVRLALNMDQVEEYGPPPNPTKMTDSRSNGYVDLHGYECWELDALDPTTIQDMVEEKILEHLDRTQWDRDTAADEADQARLHRIADNWDRVIAALGEPGEDEE
jgi:hypothetical protein